MIGETVSAPALTSTSRGRLGRGTHRSRLAGAAVATLGLVAGLVAASPLDASAARKPPPAPMPAALTPGTWTRPVFPERSVPGYFGPTRVEARVSAGDGATDARYMIPTAAGTSMVWGDWDGNGTTTPALFAGGQWLVYNRIIGAAPQPSTGLTFGAAGDRPVAGDWDGNGTTDIGVVRGNVWLLSLGTTPVGPGVQQPVWRQFAFGLPSDRVVVGDWNGDRTDTIGVVRAGRWYLRDFASAGRSRKAFAFGRPGDVPVVGDWNGDRTDTVGVVRGSTWYTRDTNTTGPTTPKAAKATKRPAARPKPVKGGPTTVRVVAHQAGAVPAPWRTLAGPTGAGCPTAARKVAAQAGYVVPSRILDRPMPVAVPAPDPAFAVRDSLRQAERYLLGAQYVERWVGRSLQPFTEIRGKVRDEELAIRRPAMAALTVAIAVRTSAHSDLRVGRTRQDAIRYTDWLVRSLACEHASVTPGGWGSGWQTAHWANLIGEAAWLIWDQLSAQTRDYVASMIVSEANVRLGMPTEYWADKAGTVLSPGNTHAEEDAWNAALLELAVNMMPRAPRVADWRAKAVELEAAAYSTKTDANSSTPVNGVALTDRLNGSNIYDDGSVENHSRIHPDYSTNIQHLWWAADLAGLAGRQTPEAAFHNAPLVYGSFSKLSFAPDTASPAGGVYLQPGGTIYRPGSGDIYYPQGSDWGVVRRAHFVSLDAHALAYGAWIAPPDAWNPRDALTFHIAAQQALAKTSGVSDGRTYSINDAVAFSQDTYPGREEYAAQQLATGWLALYVGRVGRLKVDTSGYAKPTVAFQRAHSFRQPGATSSQRETLSP
jgi:hypothetical protein